MRALALMLLLSGLTTGKGEESAIIAFLDRH
jgi:hypothetical protein